MSGPSEASRPHQAWVFCFWHKLVRLGCFLSAETMSLRTQATGPVEGGSSSGLFCFLPLGTIIVFGYSLVD